MEVLSTYHLFNTWKIVSVQEKIHSPSFFARITSLTQQLLSYI